LVTKDGVAVNFTGGAQGLAVLAITSTTYPDRIAFSGLIEDTMARFLSKGYMWSTATKNGLTSKFKKDLKDLCQEYDDVQSKDKIARLRQQVSVVQSTMQDNISKALDNLESTERLEEQSTNLMESSAEFNRSAKKLAWKEWLMLMKMRFIIAFVILAIIGIIIGFACDWGNKCQAESAPSTGGAPAASGTVSGNTPSGARLLLSMFN
jgi:preprotein translocase subunit Sss1|tara:strand:- start:139 stop:762 length:624 start_codon:yes stop_codon:yes gene_type:complete